MTPPFTPYRYISLTSKLDAPIEIAIGAIFLYDLLGMNIGLRFFFSIIYERLFFRSLLFLWSRCDVFIPSHEPLCWKSGHRYVAFIYILEV